MIKKSGKDVVVDRDELLRVIRQLVEPIIDDVDPGGYHRSFLLGGVSVNAGVIFPWRAGAIFPHFRHQEGSRAREPS